MQYETYAGYVKTLSVDQLRTMVLMYTLKIYKPPLSKSECRNLLLSQCIISDETYFSYMDMYTRLSNAEKIHLEAYQGSYYKEINKYIFKDEINILDAPRKVPLDRVALQITKKILPIISDEFDKNFKKRREEIEESANLLKLQKEIYKLYSDNIGTYNNYLRILNNSIRALYNIVTTHAITHDMILFRGERYSENSTTKSSITTDTTMDRLKQMLQTKKNDVIENPTFVSCSLNPFVAFEFSGKVCCIYRYFIKKGMRGIMLPSDYDMSEYCAVAGEFEMLLAPHAMRILNTHIINESGVYSEKNILQNFLLKKPEGYTIFDVEIVGILPPPKLRDMFYEDALPPVKHK